MSYISPVGSRELQQLVSSVGRHRVGDSNGLLQTNHRVELIRGTGLRVAGNLHLERPIPSRGHLLEVFGDERLVAENSVDAIQRQPSPMGLTAVVVDGHRSLAQRVGDQLDNRLGVFPTGRLRNRRGSGSDDGRFRRATGLDGRRADDHGISGDLRYLGSRGAFASTGHQDDQAGRQGRYVHAHLLH
jgi:hypothetical protein